MAKYRRKQVAKIIEAGQFLEGQPIPKGVCFGWRCNEGSPNDPHVHTIQEQRVPVNFGEWIIMESDGKHYYPCAPEVFAENWEAAV